MLTDRDAERNHCGGVVRQAAVVLHRPVDREGSAARLRDHCQLHCASHFPLTVRVSKAVLS